MQNKVCVARQWLRFTASLPVRLVLRAEKFAYDDSAVAIDMSLGGASVRTRLPLEPGVWVGLVRKEGFPHAIPSRVIWARRDESGLRTFAGLQFLETMQELGRARAGAQEVYREEERPAMLEAA